MLEDREGIGTSGYTVGGFLLNVGDEEEKLEEEEEKPGRDSVVPVPRCFLVTGIFGQGALDARQSLCSQPPWFELTIELK